MKLTCPLKGSTSYLEILLQDLLWRLTPSVKEAATPSTSPGHFQVIYIWSKGFCPQLCQTKQFNNGTERWERRAKEARLRQVNRWRRDQMQIEEILLPAEPLSIASLGRDVHIRGENSPESDLFTAALITTTQITHTHRQKGLFIYAG